MTIMGPMGPIPPGTPQWHQANNEQAARAGYASQLQQQQLASLHGAIAYSPSTRAYGWSSRCSDSTTAAQRALDECGAADAIVLENRQNCYLALARAADGAYGHSYAGNPRTAERSARSACLTYSNSDASDVTVVVVNTAAGQVSDEFTAANAATSRRAARKDKRSSRWLTALAIVVVLFVFGGVYDVITGNSPWGAFTSAAMIGALLVLIKHRRYRHHRQ
jgi:hypothetical protein